MVRSRGPYISCLFALLTVVDHDEATKPGFTRTEERPGYNPTLCKVLGMSDGEGIGFLASDLDDEEAKRLDALFKGIALREENKHRRIIPWADCLVYLSRAEKANDKRLLTSFIEEIWKAPRSPSAGSEDEQEGRSKCVRDRLVDTVTFENGDLGARILQILDHLHVSKVRPTWHATSVVPLMAKHRTHFWENMSS